MCVPLHVTRKCKSCKKDGCYWQHGLCNNPKCVPNLAAVEQYPQYSCKSTCLNTIAIMHVS